MIASIQSDRVISATRPQAYRHVSRVFVRALTIIALTAVNLPNMERAAEPSKTPATIEDRVRALIPDIEAYIASGMKGFDVPGLAIGIVANDSLVYAKGFGVRRSIVLEQVLLICNSSLTNCARFHTVAQGRGR